jgi:hypothetical protein
MADVGTISLRNWERDAMPDVDYAQAILASMRQSDETISVRINGKLCLLVGHFARSMFVGSGSAWMLAMPEAEKYKVTLMKFSRRVIHHLSELYPELYVATYPGNERAIRWLEWLGFKAVERQVGKTLTMVKH